MSMSYAARFEPHQGTTTERSPFMRLTARMSLAYALLLLVCFACPLPAQQAKKKTSAPKAIPLAEAIPENSSTKHTLQVDGKTIE
jgi:hypothetical protein